MTNSFSTKVIARHKHTRARILQVTTPHGEFITPVFMPVGTRAGVNNMTPVELKNANSQVILGGNTYHMLCAPGMQIIEAAGGMHRFMGWDSPMLTDSGGFQVFSLSKNNELCRIDETGAHFLLPDSGETIHMTPEMSLETQKIIGADMIMAFDQCTPDSASYETAKAIMERTHRWLEASVAYHQAYPNSRYGYKQALFGIIQGSIYPKLRQESAAFIASQPLDGVALGGETIGFDMAKTVDVIRWVYEWLPDDKPRYTMGVGMSPQDLLDVVKEGIDMFDCVAPTRNARHGALYCGEFIQKNNWLHFESRYQGARIQIKKACFADDLSPITPGCACYTCTHHSRAFLHDLFKRKAPSFTALASIHNIFVLHEACSKMRALILNEGQDAGA